MKAFLLAAGLGTRLRPFTDKHPKALAMVNGKSLLEINIRNLQRFGVFDIVVNVHHFADQIINTLEVENGFGSNFEVSNEKDEILETGGGLKKAADYFKSEEDFLVMNVDILSDFDLNSLIQKHRNSGALATLAVQNRDSSRFLLFDEEDRLRAWKNIQTQKIKNPGNLDLSVLKSKAFSGIQMLRKEIFKKINQNGKFSLIDVYLDLCSEEEIICWDHSGDKLLDVGKPESLILASEIFNS